jgi:hypothetical protein
VSADVEPREAFAAYTRGCHAWTVNRCWSIGFGRALAAIFADTPTTPRYLRIDFRQFVGDVE